MPVEPLNPVVVIVGIAALLAAIVGIVQSLGKIRRAWLRVEHVLTDLLGSPETATTPEVLSLRALAKKTAADMHQVKGALPALATSVELDILAEQVAAVKVQVSQAQATASVAAEAAKQATTAAGVAVGEAKAARGIISDAVAELRDDVSSVATTLAEEQTERRVKESAYVAALDKLGVPLTPIINELEGPHS